MEATPIPNPAGTLPDARRAPLDLPRLVMRRAAVVAVLGVAAWLLLGLARMRDDVDDELAGARSLAVLFEHLSTVSAVDDDAQARQMLAGWADEGLTRHLRVQVSDAGGQVLMRLEPEGQVPALLQGLVEAGEWLFRPAPPFTVAWTLARPAGAPWTVSVTPAPQSERAEALRVLLAGGALLAALAAAMLAVMAWNTRRALAPMAHLLDAIHTLEPGEGHAGGVRALPTMPISELETIAAALRRLDGSLEAAQAHRQQLARQVMVLQEDERQHLARELHDEFGQQLTALRANAAWLQRRLAELPEAALVARDMATQCEAIQQDVRSVLARLRPLPRVEDEAGAPLTLASLGSMLVSLVAAWPRGAAAATQVQLRLDWTDAAGAAQDWSALAPTVPAPQVLVLALYRISQEALTNAARHAQATQVQLHLGVRAQAGGGWLLDWSVSDDGCGLPEGEQALGRGNGLAGIQQRLWALGADLVLAPSAPGSAQRPGCRLSTQVLLPEGEGADE